MSVPHAASPLSHRKFLLSCSLLRGQLGLRFLSWNTIQVKRLVQRVASEDAQCPSVRHW